MSAAHQHVVDQALTLSKSKAKPKSKSGAVQQQKRAQTALNQNGKMKANPQFASTSKGKSKTANAKTPNPKSAAMNSKSSSAPSSADLKRKTPSSRKSSVKSVDSLQKRANFEDEIVFLMGSFGDGRSLTSSARILHSCVRAYLIDVVVRAKASAPWNTASNFGVSMSDLLFIVRKDKLRKARVDLFLHWRDGGRKRTVDELLSAVTPKAEEADSKTAAGEMNNGNNNASPDANKFSTHTENRSKSLLDQVDSTFMSYFQVFMKYGDWRTGMSSSNIGPKTQRFRAWMEKLLRDFKLDSESTELMGYLAWDIAGVVVGAALRIKERELVNANKRRRLIGLDSQKFQSIESQLNEPYRVLLPDHIREAALALQPRALVLRGSLPPLQRQMRP